MTEIEIIKTGGRYRSAVCPAEFVIVRAPAEAVDLRCGGEPMVAAAVERSPADPSPEFGTGTLIGKRYVDESGQLEVLCTKAGGGALSVGGTIMTIKEAKSLPSSD